VKIAYKYLFLIIFIYGSIGGSLWGSDEESIESLRELTSASITISSDSTFHYANRLLKVSINKKDLASEAFALRYIGIAYTQAGDYEKALESFQQSLKKAYDSGSNEEIANSTNSMGAYYYLTGNLKRALEYYEKALK
jgi:tetratricopeptide (TPR) repeat protein